ncbi:hypothetical protein GOODEAATRI_010366, partial [Goodea atripinnis]
TERFALRFLRIYAERPPGCSFAMRRCAGALFEIALRKRWPAMTYRLLKLCKVIDKRLWDFAHPLRQFPNLSHVILNRLEEKRLTVDKLKEMKKDEIGKNIMPLTPVVILRSLLLAVVFTGHMLHHVNIGLTVKQCVHQIPAFTMEASTQPITRSVLRVRLIITPDFRWNDQVHGSVGEPWWLWVEDPINDHIYHSEYFLLQKKQPLPVTALGNREFESLYKFTHFNPIQTQIFHTLYHTDTNVLLGAPTGSGKTIAAELAMFRVFNKYPSSKVSEDRGPVLEVIVSRTNFISSHTSKSVRVVGLSTALANARDLADWLGIRQVISVYSIIITPNLSQPDQSSKFTCLGSSETDCAS